MAQTLNCSIVTPQAAVLDEPVSYASIPAWDGQVGVMTGQSPILTRLGMGALRLDMADGSGSRLFLIEGGFAQVQQDTLTVLTEAATPAAELDLEEAEAALAEANARVAQAGPDLERVVADQQRALAKKLVITMRGEA